MRKLLIGALFAAVLGSGCAVSQADQVARKQDKIGRRAPKNVIVMIGDGMGLSQLSAALYSNQNTLHIAGMPVVGLHKSYSSDSLVTDSAAGATAFACGTKTYNYAVGVGPDSLGRTNLVELAEARGMATGVVVSCSVTHATPGAFVSHVTDRRLYEDIAKGYLDVDIDLILGGGKKYFERRADGRNLCTELENRGYYVTDFTREPLEMMVWPDKNLAFFTADSEPLPVSQGRDYLPLASRLSVDFLKGRSKKGFFLMIEGSQIDWGGHANDSDYIVSETLDFDKAVGAILEWAAKDGETLVIVTADHETGGYAIQPKSQMGSLVTAFTTGGHTAELIPVYAFGPGALNFTGVYENTEIFDKIKRLAMDKP